MKKKPLGLKYSTMNNHFVKGQRVPSKKYKENYDKIKWDHDIVGITTIYEHIYQGQDKSKMTRVSETVEYGST